jgi:branched-chain amino acid transport system ATP-binding protein
MSAAPVRHLRVEGLNKSFGGLHALRDSTFECEAGRINCLVGPNGAGKTTIFNAVTGFLTVDAGTVHFGNEAILGLSPQDIVARGIARTFQDLRLFNEQTARDNVLLAMPRPFGEKLLTALVRPLSTENYSRTARDEADAFLARVGLADKAREGVRNLSYGEQKLLTIARVLATGAELILLDEPASGLSRGALDRMIALMFELKATGKSLLVVEHNTRVVRQIADDVLFLHQGHVLARGTAEEIVSNPKLTEIYFGGKL